MKLIAQALMGAIVGFFATLAILKGDIALSLARFSFELNLFLLVAGALLIIGSTIYYIQFKQAAQKEVSGEEEDALDDWKYNRFSDISMAMHATLITNLLFTCTSTLTEQPLWMISISGLFLVISLVLSFIKPTLIRIMYPERSFPSPNDKDYSKKLMEISDEGERHVMLQGLYKSFNSVNSLLMLGILLLLFYSLASGASQLFGITVIAVILLFTNIQYILSVKGK